MQSSFFKGRHLEDLGGSKGPLDLLRWKEGRIERRIRMNLDLQACSSRPVLTVLNISSCWAAYKNSWSGRRRWCAGPALSCGQGIPSIVKCVRYWVRRWIGGDGMGHMHGPLCAARSASIIICSPCRWLSLHVSYRYLWLVLVILATYLSRYLKYHQQPLHSWYTKCFIQPLQIQTASTQDLLSSTPTH